MRQPAHRAARRAASFAIAALAGVLLAAILVESGQMPIVYAVRAYGPLAVLATLPLFPVVIALGRGPSRHALAIGVAYSTLCLAALWLALSRRYASGSEGSMDVLYAFLFPWFNTAWLLFLPAMVRLAIASWRAYRALPELAERLLAYLERRTQWAF